MSPEDLIQYSHRISQASSVISPVGWQLSKQGEGKDSDSVLIVYSLALPGDPRRPFPQDIEMRSGFLGELTSGVKPHPQQPSTTDVQQRGGGDILPPPGKKFAMAGRIMCDQCETLLKKLRTYNIGHWSLLTIASSVIIGMNQNLNNHEQGGPQQLGLVESAAGVPAGAPVRVCARSLFLHNLPY